MTTAATPFVRLIIADTSGYKRCKLFSQPMDAKMVQNASVMLVNYKLTNDVMMTITKETKV